MRSKTYTIDKFLCLDYHSRRLHRISDFVVDFCNNDILFRHQQTNTQFENV